VRDPWSAVPLVAQGIAGRGTATPLVYEVNGLPSIELPYSYRALGATTLAKIRSLELDCLAHADAIVTPSQVLADRLTDLLAAHGMAANAPIHVIRNGARVPDEPLMRPPAAPARYLVYVGALQRWQGIDNMLAAFARLADIDDLRLVICSATPAKRARPWRRLANRLGVDERIDWHFKVPHRDVAAWLAHAAVSLAPLSDCSRNVDQGCCPLKVLESMAVGTAVIASDLPVTRELVDGDTHGRLVAPDRPAELARAIRIALEYPDRTAGQGRAAQAHVRERLTWERSRAQLRDVYESVLVGRRGVTV
jgi:glycosyltransferase involved in cell wall biosynthesis